MSPARARGLALLALGISGALVAFGIVHFGIPLGDAERLAEAVRDTGALAPLLLLLLLVVQSVVAPLPSQPVMMAAGFVYGPWLGFGISWLGVLAGALACFGIARLLGRPAVRRFVAEERLAAVDAYVGEHGLRGTFLAVLSLRLFAHFSFDVTSYACGLVRFPLGWFALATALGEIPKVLLFSALGAGLGRVPGWLGGVLGASVVAMVGVVLLLRRAAATSPAAAPASRTSRSTP